MKKLWLLGSLLVPIIFLSACGLNEKSNVSVASIQQVLGNSEKSIQSNGLFYFDKGSLHVLIVYSPFQNPNLEPSNSEFKETYKNDLEMFNKEFLKDKLTEEDYHSEFEKDYKDVVLKIDEKAKEVTLTSKDIKKVFTMSESNDKRLIDSLGNEYELTIDEK